MRTEKSKIMLATSSNNGRYSYWTLFLARAATLVVLCAGSGSWFLIWRLQLQLQLQLQLLAGDACI
jgi:hypothetical protein